MQYTIRQIPKNVDKALRQKAKAQKKSLNQLAVEALTMSAGVAPAPKRDLSFMKGSVANADAIEDSRRVFDQINPEAWR